MQNEMQDTTIAVPIPLHRELSLHDGEFDLDVVPSRPGGAGQYSRGDRPCLEIRAERGMPLTIETQQVEVTV
jgi:hypothetical protein